MLIKYKWYDGSIDFNQLYNKIKAADDHPWIDTSKGNTARLRKPLFKNDKGEILFEVNDVLGPLLENPSINNAFLNAWRANTNTDNINRLVTATVTELKVQANIYAGKQNNQKIAKNYLNFLITLLNPIIKIYINGIIIETDKKKAKRGGGSTDSESYETLSKEVTEKLHHSLERYKSDLSQCEKQKEAHEEEIKTLTQKITTLQTEIRKSMLDLATTLETNLDESKEAPLDNTEQYKTLITETQKRLAESDTTLKEARQNLEGLKAETPSIDKKIQDLQGLIKDIEELITTLTPPPKQQGGSVQTHPLLELAAAISSATASLAPK